MDDDKANKVELIDDELLDILTRRKKISISTSHFRCAQCNKLLAKPNVKGKIAAQIKCPRCGTVNEI